MALVKGSVKVDTGSANDYVQAFTAGNTILAGDVVWVEADGYVDTLVADEQVAMGWALNGATSGETVLVLKGAPGVSYVMPTSGTEAITNVGEKYALTVSTICYVDLTDTGNDLFRVLEIDTTNELARVSIIASAYQGA